MTDTDLTAWQDDFDQFVARFADLFSRREPREQANKYLRGLLAPVERKNSWQLAEQGGDRTPDATQRLLYKANWDADLARDRLFTYVGEQFGSEQAIGIVDDTGFLKQGTHSVGVKRQYTGTAGKAENCQIGVFLTYASGDNHVLLDRRLYLPKEEWIDNQSRRAAARVPDELTYQSKSALAVTMLKAAWAAGIPMRWVTADEAYGNTGSLRRAIASAGKLYVVAVAKNLLVWVDEPRPKGSGRQAKARPRGAQSIVEVLTAQELGWQRLALGSGEQGDKVSEWARLRVVECDEGEPGAAIWLLVRRPVGGEGEWAYYLSNADVNVSLREIAQVAEQRWAIELCFAEAKGEAGLDQYEVRHYHSWYRHITLAMMAHAWLSAIRAQSKKKPGADGTTMSEAIGELSVAEVRRLLVIVFGMMVRDEEQILGWSRYRRRARQKARISHAKRRSKLLVALSPLPSE